MYVSGRVFKALIFKVSIPVENPIASDRVFPVVFGVFRDYFVDVKKSLNGNMPKDGKFGITQCRYQKRFEPLDVQAK